MYDLYLVECEISNFLYALKDAQNRLVWYCTPIESASTETIKKFLLKEVDEYKVQLLKLQFV